MKKAMRLTALLLSLVMCLGVTVFAANVENELATITGANGAVAEFVTDGAAEEKIRVTYTDANAIVEGAYYLVMVIKPDADGEYVPTEDSILYINQTTGSADHSVSFEVFASRQEGRIEDSAILIYGMADGELKAAIIEAKYILGDVDEDGVITASDAAVVLRAVAGVDSLDGNQNSAANVDGDAAVTASDAAKILRVVAGLDQLA